MGQGGLSWLHVKEGHFCQINREGGVPEFGTLHPARDYPSAPSVDFKHDRGNCAVGDVRDMKERVAERTPLNSKGGGGLCLDLATGQNRRGQKFLSTHTQKSYGHSFTIHHVLKYGETSSVWNILQQEYVWEFPQSGQIFDPSALIHKGNKTHPALFAYKLVSVVAE